jgi:hypothetical protein
LNCDQNSRILVACDNTYTMESKDEMYLLTLYSLSFATSFHMQLVLGD